MCQVIWIVSLIGLRDSWRGYEDTNSLMSLKLNGLKLSRRKKVMGKWSWDYLWSLVPFFLTSPIFCFLDIMNWTVFYCHSMTVLPWNQLSTNWNYKTKRPFPSLKCVFRNCVPVIRRLTDAINKLNYDTKNLSSKHKSYKIVHVNFFILVGSIILKVEIFYNVL